jgi:hypothetical protein
VPEGQQLDGLRLRGRRLGEQQVKQETDDGVHDGAEHPASVPPPSASTTEFLYPTGWTGPDGTLARVS